MKREKREAATGVALGRLADCLVLGEHPTICEYLGDGQWEDGSERLRSTLLILFEDGRMKVCLHDRDGRRSMWVTGISLKGCLEALECGLCDGTVEWRKSKG